MEKFTTVKVRNRFRKKVFHICYEGSQPGQKKDALSVSGQGVLVGQYRTKSATTGGKALAAIHRTIFPGLERNLRGLATVGAHGVIHLAGSASGGTVSLACLAAVAAAGGLVLEALFGVEGLLTSGENEFFATVFAHQRLIFVHD